jgi:hypothetical protein
VYFLCTDSDVSGQYLTVDGRFFSRSSLSPAPNTRLLCSRASLCCPPMYKTFSCSYVCTERPYNKSHGRPEFVAVPLHAFGLALDSHRMNEQPCDVTAFFFRGNNDESSCTAVPWRNCTWDLTLAFGNLLHCHTVLTV